MLKRLELICQKGLPQDIRHSQGPEFCIGHSTLELPQDVEISMIFFIHKKQLLLAFA
jgi:hypothetical protein